MNSFDNLYVPDPYSGSILKPQAIWMVLPDNYWPNRPYVGDNFDTWTGDKWPFDSSPNTAPRIPTVPWTPDYTEEEIQRLMEKARRAREQAKQSPEEDKARWLNILRSPEKKNHEWTNSPDGGLKFTLELAGRSRESVSIEINSDNCIIVSRKTNKAQLGGTYRIPSPDKFNLEAAQLTMEHGLLTILFPPKKVMEKRSIKLL